MKYSLLTLSLCLLLSLQTQAQQLRGHAQAAKGNHQSLSFSGWACLKSNKDPIKVSLYAGDAIETATFVQAIHANERTFDSVKNLCDSTGNHGFFMTVDQDTLFQYAGKQAFIVHEQDGVKRRLGNVDSFFPDFPKTRLRGVTDGIVEVNGAYFVMGWACQTDVVDPVSLEFSVLSDNGSVEPVMSDVTTSTINGGVIEERCNTVRGKHRFRTQIPNEIIRQYGGKKLLVNAVARYGQNKQRLVHSGRFSLPSILPKAEEVVRPNIIVFFTDDQGYADLGVQQSQEDIKTPNIDRLAINGARFTNGYVTAPQCSPSRAAMLTGIYQNRFRLDENRHIPLTLEVHTLADRLKAQGYKTGMAGKWHLEIMGNSVEWGQTFYPSITPFRVGRVPQEVRQRYFPHKRGFDDVFAGYTGSFLRTFNENGNSIPVETYRNREFRVDLVSDASLTLIDKHWRNPFFLYISHYAPHVPLEATQKYLDQFPGDMPERRRYALAMMAALDDGVGRVLDKLENYNILDNTLIFFISDNGAPIGTIPEDTPITKGGTWNGSVNTPFTGEKGMLTEGALRVPYIMHWPDKIRGGQVIHTPVSSLDAAYTLLKAGGVESLEDLDGMDLVPLVTGEDVTQAFMQRPLFWRFYYQRAVRQGNWKYMQAGIKREYLFDMTLVEPESVNYIDDYPEVAAQLKARYWEWAAEMPRPETLKEIPIPFGRRVDHHLPPNN
ncbi:sulfatase family protein [Agaribacter flavus]|uniref:Sulfatase n=1 Tax=Agaribacter flavus TaxID=1902781 RepID=A0ABV7FLN9_9ALTE